MQFSNTQLTQNPGTGDYLESARRGVPESQYMLAEQYVRGRGRRRDVRRAKEWLLRASEQGMVAARYQLGVLHECPGPLRDLDEALRWYRIAADGGIREAAERIRIIMASRPVDTSARELARCRAEAEGGSADAQYRLGLFLERERPDRLPEVLKWFRRAAEQGHAEAQFRLAYVQSGLSGDEHHKQAYHWLCRAAESGLPVAQYTLATLLEQGNGVPADPARAQQWYERAAAQGYVGGQDGHHYEV